MRIAPHIIEIHPRHHVNQNWTFISLGSDFALIFGANRLYKAKILSNTNLFLSKHLKGEKASLELVGVCCSEMSMLKHPIMFGLFVKLAKSPLSHPETSLTTMCVSCR